MSLSQQTFGLGRELQILGIKIEGLEAMVDIQASDKYAIELASNNYQVQMANIGHFMKNNAWLKQKLQASLSPACVYHLVRSFNSLIHKDLIHIYGAGSLVW